MSDAQARRPEGCAAPVASTTGEAAALYPECIARADELRRWVEDLQALILGADGD